MASEGFAVGQLLGRKGGVKGDIGRSGFFRGGEGALGEGAHSGS